MKEINDLEFISLVTRDRHWATKLTEPVAITTFCELSKCPIVALSPLLHFKGKNINGEVAHFRECGLLKVAQGNFYGAVEFESCGLEKIDVENFIIHECDSFGNAAWFEKCPDLKIAEGVYPGYVSFHKSGMKEMNLTVLKPNEIGNAATFHDCAELTVAKGSFPGRVGFSRTNLTQTKDLVVTHPNKEGKAVEFVGCKNLKQAEGDFNGSAYFSYSLVERIGDLKIHQADNTRAHIDLVATPVAYSAEEMKKLVRTTFGKLGIPQLIKMRNKEGKEWPMMDAALKEQIEHLKRTKEKQSKAVEFEIE